MNHVTQTAYYLYVANCEYQGTTPLAFGDWYLQFEELDNGYNN